MGGAGSGRGTRGPGHDGIDQTDDQRLVEREPQIRSAAATRRIIDLVLVVCQQLEIIGTE